MIGMSFDTIDHLSKEVDAGRKSVETLRNELYKFKNMTLIDRVKAVFKKPRISCI